MRGLLLKDCFTLVKQMKIFLFLIIVFAVIPGYNMSIFAVVYSALLPITALAYDERSKWDSLAATMPYKPRDLVLSKYLLGYAAVFAASLLSLMAQGVTAAVRHTSFGADELISALLVFCVAAIMLAVIMPFMYRFGVERGRLAFFVIVGVCVAASVVFFDRLTDGTLVDTLSKYSLPAVCAAAVGGAVIVSAASILISTRIYSKKEF